MLTLATSVGNTVPLILLFVPMVLLTVAVGVTATRSRGHKD